MEMHQLRYFLALCETQNFTRASEKCNISQPALTKSIQRLEEALGGQLFQRNKNRSAVALTEFGKQILPSLQNLYETACRTKAHAMSLAPLRTKHLKIGIMCTIGLRQLISFLAAFARRHPDIEIAYENNTLTELHDKLDKAEIDLAICSAPYELPSRLSGNVLFEENFHIAFPAGHRFEKLERIPMSEMHGEIYVSRQNCEYSDLLSDMMDKRGVAVQTKHETPREDWIQEMVLAGMGVAYIPESMPLYDELLTRPVCEPEVTREIRLLRIAEREVSQEMREFMTAATNHAWSKDYKKPSRAA